MAPFHRTAAFLWAALTLFLSIRLVAAQEPQMGVTYFDNLPGKLFYFEDTSSAFYHDIADGDVYITQDEGKSWDLASGVPRGVALMVIQHPFDTRYAFILTTDNTHYRSDDRGRTWRSFHVPNPPAYTFTPLSFHSDPSKWGYIIYQGTQCISNGWEQICSDVAYYTMDGFSSEPRELFTEVSRCQFAHSSKDFKHDAHPDLIFCVAFDSSSSGPHSISESRLFSSTDFFQTKALEDLGTGRGSKGVIAFAIVSKFAVVALRDLSPGADGDMMLYVSLDSKEWAKAQFPHASQARLRENAYTIVESTIHSLAVDVLSQTQSTIGTLFVSNSNGTYFVESLRDTNRNAAGFVDYENVYGVEGVGIANTVSNALDVEHKGQPKRLRSMITFDDGSSWSSLRPPDRTVEGEQVPCSTSDREECSLHLYSVTDPHNFGRIFSSAAPGLVLGVGSIGRQLAPYDECDTFLSTDAGLTWRMVHRDAHIYEFGDSGSLIVLVNDEGLTDVVQYSMDFGNSWRTFNLGMNIRARGLTGVSDATSQKFMLLGQLSRQDQKPGQGRYAIIHLDFAGMRSRKCSDNDFEPWYARAKPESECLMGVRQWYRRRKADADCYVGDKFIDPIIHEDPCPCEDHDFECDYNYIRSGDQCVPSGPERVPNTVCTSGRPDETYMGSSGWRLIAGNKCDRARGVRKDEPVSKQCSQAQPAEGEVTSQIFEFPAAIVQYQYFPGSNTILVRLSDHSVWQSSNEGYTWEQKYPEERFLAFYMHSHANDRAYLITDGRKYYATTDGGRFWRAYNAPSPPNSFHARVLNFQPRSDCLIWVGDVGCDDGGERCRAEAQYSCNHGDSWRFIDDYVVDCGWARDEDLRIDATQILCESYLNKQGSQRFFGRDNPLQLISGRSYYEKKTKLFDDVVGFTKFSEFLIVAQFLPQRNSLDLQVSLDGRTFASGRFPPGMHPDTHAYTILESSTDSIFLHMTMTTERSPHWGNILKSNSNGTYFSLSIANVNRDDYGYVDFEKFAGLDGIALVNIVANPAEAVLTGSKTLQTRITHNDGGTWKLLTPPPQDSLGQLYSCSTTSCALHVHGYTERTDARATYSSPSVVGVVMAVGNVGETLAPYTESDTFLSRDGGFTWEEVHKDAHLWEFGDSGSIIILVNDEEPTDHVLFTTDEGLTWREYRFSRERMRIRTIITVPEETSRKFILLGDPSASSKSSIVYLDFTSLTHKQCVLDEDNPGHDDFELWSPSEERQEVCLFGRQTLYHRRKRNANCVVGKIPKIEQKIERNCACTMEDFECEFNYVKDALGKCMLVSGTTPLPSDGSCRGDDEYWYERTAYRKIPYSSCEDGLRPDRGTRHFCPGIRGHSAFFWLTIIFFPFALTALLAWWWFKRSGLARGTIRLPAGADYLTHYHDSGSNAFDTIASVPWFLFGLASVAYEYVSSSVDSLTATFRARRGYRDLPIDEDAQILRFEDEE